MKRLLVVEDHPWVLQAVCGALTRRGSMVASATSLRDAQRRVLQDDPYDVVICEQNLSEGAGLKLLAWLRWQQHIPVPFLLITRNDRLASEYHEDFGVLAKPFRSEQLLSSLKRLLRNDARGVITCQIPFAAETRNA